MIDKYLKSKEDCNGCYACVNACSVKSITMETDKEGFWYPKVDYSKCVNCKKCINVCSSADVFEKTNNAEAFACFNKDEKTRLDSSSGGIFSLLAEYVIKSNGVVFGALFNDEFEVIHGDITSIDGISLLRGSKYVQSKIGTCYQKAKAYLEEGKLVLFSGTPCQIGGLSSFLGKTYKNLIKVDIICHGVPSPLVWKHYLKYMNKENRYKINKVSFRDKSKGWFDFGMRIGYENSNDYYKSHFKDTFMRAFLKDICLRPSCYKCQFKTINRSSDITLADFWGISEMKPQMDDNKGVSLALANSDKGKEFINKLNNNMVIEQVDFNQAINHNKNAFQSAKCHENRKSFFEKLGKFKLDKIVKEYCVDSFFIRVRRVALRILKI